MSKSLGNGVDPMEVIEQYGADALRWFLANGSAPGQDVRYSTDKMDAAWNFINKIWNASRYALMNIGDLTVDQLDITGEKTLADKWILTRLNQVIAKVTELFEKFEFGEAGRLLYRFIWDDFCDWYIEMVKPRLYNEEDDTKAAAIWTLKHVLIQALKLLHPFMPFISEEIFCNLQEEEETIMVSQWPVYRDDWNFAKEEQSTETIKEAVRAIRGVRSSMNVSPSKKATVYVVSEDAGLLQIFEHSKSFFAALGYAGEVILQENKEGIADDAVSAVIHKAVIYMPFADLVDIEKEIERLRGEEKRLAGELARSRGMLGNEKFVNRAPEAKIAEERAKLEKYEQMMEQVKIRLAQLQ